MKMNQKSGLFLVYFRNKPNFISKFPAQGLRHLAHEAGGAGDEDGPVLVELGNLGPAPLCIVSN